MTTIERIHASGILRMGTPARGFRYQRVDGGKVTLQDLARIRTLRIPPAWIEVAINAAASGRVQVVGRDAAGRWQYLYHDSHIRQREQKKFIRLIKFGENLPAMRRAVNRDLRKPGLPRERVLGGIVRILSAAFLRPGSEVYASENGSYGVATLRPRHVSVKGSTVTFSFRGKSGVMHESQFEDRHVARLMRQLLKQTNRRVFKYENGDGQLVNVGAQTLNTYIREIMTDSFSAKDFRTWSGTLLCACSLARRRNEDPEHERSVKRIIVSAIKETARALGNTPAVCRSSYICPAVIEAFEKDKTISDYFKGHEHLASYRLARLHPAEKALLRLLKTGQ
ncbi:MAG: DNA topoisomerase IB [Pyrinomonadaceae bacterium]